AVSTGSAAAHHEGPFGHLAAIVRTEPQRVLFLLIAALLAIVAVAVPRLGDESLSSLLFLAGAGLVAAVLWTPSPSLSAEARAAAPSTPRSLRPAVAPSREQKCFAELTSLPRTAPALDRA